ncbi:hypothetical protein Goari_023714, partial [Gossypium aridum]|nr:hypothetical protein [Gossypium aridum]
MCKTLLVEIIFAGKAIDNHFMELRAIHKLIQRNWRIRIHHIPKAYDVVADFIAKYPATGFTGI